MVEKPLVLCLIPARGGSKTIPRKNLQLLADKPLVAYSIEQSLETTSIDRTIVSTDDPEIAQIAQYYGAEVPFLRPAEISGDDATDLETFTHAIEWLKIHQNYEPQICVHLRPTYPLRRVEDIDCMVEILCENPELDSVRSVTIASETPFKMWFRDDSGRLTPIVNSELVEPYNMPRQLLPQVFFQNAAIDVVRTRVITEMRSMSGKNIFGHVMDSNFDIDTQADLMRVAQQFPDGVH